MLTSGKIKTRPRRSQRDASSTAEFELTHRSPISRGLPREIFRNDDGSNTQGGQAMIYHAACHVDELLNAAKQIASEIVATVGQTVAAKSSASTAMGEA
jgi:hypothetical protein